MYTTFLLLFFKNFQGLFKVSGQLISLSHTDEKDKLLEWPDRSCLLLYVIARIH